MRNTGIAVAIAIVLILSLFAILMYNRNPDQAAEPASGQPIAPDLQPPAREVIGGPSSGRPYSPAVRIGDTLYVSGQIAIDPEGNEVRDSVEAETEQVLNNIKRWVEEAGFEMSDVVRATVFLSDINDYDAMNSAYIRFFPENPPARACVAVREIVRGFRVEISCIAQR